MRHVTRGGRFYRALGPSALWAGRPDDTSFSKRYGGRWNPPGEFGALYLSADIETARANGIEILKKLLGDAASIDDLVDPNQFFEVQAFDVSPTKFVDCVTSQGRKALSLPAHSKKGEDYARTQSHAREAYADGESGITYLSAVNPDHEELAIFDFKVGDIARMRGKRTTFATLMTRGRRQARIG